MLGLTFHSKGGMRILAVDDDPPTLIMLSAILEAHDVQVVGATSIAEAVKRASVEPFDAILMDVHVGSASGIDAVRQIRASATNRDTGVLFLTGAELRAATLESLPGPRCEVIMKPYSMALVVKHVLGLIAGERPAPVEQRVTYR